MKRFGKEVNLKKQIQHNKFAGTTATLENVEWLDMEYPFINFGADVPGLGHYYQ
jgi:hypothetical protein